MKRMKLSRFLICLALVCSMVMPLGMTAFADEIAGGVITLKDMSSGEQKTLPVCEAVALLKDGLAAKNAGTVILEK